MRIMGLDIGTKTIGVAISDPLGFTAQGIETIKRTNWNKDFNRLKELVSEYHVERIVLGFPKNLNNTIGPSGQHVLKFKEKLEKKLLIPIDLWDERMTTMAAERTLIMGDTGRKKRKGVIDKIAAVLILQGYLDRLQKGGIEMCNEKDCLGHELEGDFEEEIIVLKDEDGVEHEFEVLGIVDIDELEYAILYPVDGNTEEEAIAFRIERDGDEETLVIVEDEEELEKVRLAWEANFEEEE